MPPYSHVDVYAAYDRIHTEQARVRAEAARPKSAYEEFKSQSQRGARRDGFQNIETCRRALDALDGLGWQRSYHQRMFHENFIRASARIFFKTEPDGTFQRAHQVLLDLNNWDNLSQEILISTPRRFGKTISVSMFAAAIVFSAPGVVLSIYSTCKRISQMLLRNISKFLNLIYKGLNVLPLKVVRKNTEEIILQGPNGDEDTRTVNSYPSKVGDPTLTPYRSGSPRPGTVRCARGSSAGRTPAPHTPSLCSDTPDSTRLARMSRPRQTPETPWRTTSAACCPARSRASSVAS